MEIPGTGNDWRAWLSERAAELESAVLFLTRLPFPRGKAAGSAALAAAALAQAVWAFPIAGVLVGAAGAVVYALAHRLGVPPWPAAALALAATMVTTGALHEDGLADTADGFGGGTTREQKLDIMHDSRTGAYGVCALALSILLRASALASLADTTLVVPALIAAHGAARAVMPVFMTLVPPARRDGLSATAGRPSGVTAAVAALLGILVTAICLGPAGAALATILLVVVLALMARLSFRQIGGQTGDTLGALEQVGEIVVLLVAAS
jgi:adenosylcobinamide-GDP ribazoletransferase